MYHHSMIPIGQIPNLITLSSRIREASGDNPEAQRLQEFYLEQLQYCVYAAVNAVLGLADKLVHSTDGVPAPDSAGPGHAFQKPAAIDSIGTRGLNQGVIVVVASAHCFFS